MDPFPVAEENTVELLVDSLAQQLFAKTFPSSSPATCSKAPHEFESGYDIPLTVKTLVFRQQCYDMGFGEKSGDERVQSEGDPQRRRATKRGRCEPQQLAGALDALLEAAPLKKTAIHIDASEGPELRYLREVVDSMEIDEYRLKSIIKDLKAQIGKLELDYETMEISNNIMKREKMKEIETLREEKAECNKKAHAFKLKAENFEAKFNDAQCQIKDNDTMVSLLKSAGNSTLLQLKSWSKYVAAAREQSKVCPICFEDYNPVLNMAREDFESDRVPGSDAVESKVGYALNCGNKTAHVICETCINKEYYVENPYCPFRCGTGGVCKRNVRNGALKLHW